VGLEVLDLQGNIGMQQLDDLALLFQAIAVYMTYYPPSGSNSALTELPTDSEQVKIVKNLFIRYFNSLGALQNAWIVVVLDVFKAPSMYWWLNKETFEMVANVGNVGRSITATFALVINYRYSDDDKTHKKLNDLHKQIADCIVRLNHMPGVKNELTLLFWLTNFQAHFNHWTPCISAQQMLLYYNFVKSNAKLNELIPKLDNA
jgi:hypothetical protein